MMKMIGKNVLRCFILLILGVAAGTALLTLVFLIPVSDEKAQESFAVITEEPSYPALPVVGDLTGMNFHSYKPGVLDNSSDKIMLYTALDASGSDQSALHRSMGMYNEYLKMEYSYYWHGYVSVLRPLLSIFDYGDLRFLNGLLQMLLIFILVRKIRQKKGRIYGLIMFTSYILLMPIALMFSLQYTWVFYIAMLSALFLICRSEWAAEDQRYVAVFFLTGMLTSYFDLLTYPVFTWGIPVLWWIMMRRPEKKELRPVAEVVISGISWVSGYGIFWAMKWCVGTFILKENIIQSAIDEVFFRSGMEEKLSAAERLSAVYTNWKHYGYFIYAFILLAWLIWGLAKGLRKGWTIQYNIFAYCLAGVSSVVWYFVLANHTLGHHMFTYRILNVSVVAFLAIWAGAFGEEGTGDKYAQWNWRIKSVTVILIIIGSVGGAFLAREEIWVNNGYAPYHQIRWSGQEVLTMEFRPARSGIKELGICTETCEGTGRMEIRLLDGNHIIYQEFSSLEDWGEETYHSIPVEWKLKKGKEYIMEIRLLENSEAVEILVTDEDVLPLTEYGILRIGGEAAGGQIVSGITYWTYPESAQILILLTFTWMGILSCMAMALYTFYTSVKEKILR